MRGLEKKTKFVFLEISQKNTKILEIGLEIQVKRQKSQKMKKMDFVFFFKVAHMKFEDMKIGEKRLQTSKKGTRNLLLSVD